MASGTFEPTWTANLYTITWDAGDGTNGTISTDVTKQTFGNAIKLPPNPTREGYKFLGWYNAQTDGKSVHPVTGDIKTVEADTKEYFAHWSDDPVPGTVTLKAPVGAAFTRNQVITYNNATGTHPSVTYVNESELIITYTVDTKNFSLDVLRPSRDGCEFANWTPAVTAPVWNKTSEVYAEATYTAVFDEFDYVITYVDEENKPLVGWTDKDGNFAENILTFGYNGATEPALPVLKKRGYAWEKWTVKGSQTAITEVPKGSSDITIVAHFTALPYVIEIDFDGGRSEGDVYKQTLDMNYNAPKWTLPPNEDHNLKKDGYRFSHFAAYKSKSDFENDATSFVYAKLEPGETRTMLGLGDSEADDVRYVRAVWTERIAVDVPTDVSFGVLVDFSDQKLHFQYGKTSYDATAAKDTLAPLTFTSYTTAPLGIVAVESESDATETSKVFDEKADQVSVTLSGDSADSVVHMVGLRQTLTPPPGTDRLAGLDLAAATTAGMPTTIRFGLDFGDLAFDKIAFNESATIARLHYTVAILKDGASTAGSSVLGAVDEDGKKVVW